MTCLSFSISTKPLFLEVSLVLVVVMMGFSSTGVAADKALDWEERLSWGEEIEGVRLGCATFFRTFAPDERVLLRYRLEHRNENPLRWSPEKGIEWNNEPPDGRKPETTLFLWGPDGELITPYEEPNEWKPGPPLSLAKKPSHTGTILLDKYFSIENPGEYRGVLQFHAQVIEEGTQPVSVPVTVTSATFTFSITPATLAMAARGPDAEVHKWMALWDSCFSVDTENANRYLIAMGTPAVPILFDRLVGRDDYATQSWKILTGMKAADSMAIPRAKQISSDRSLDPKDDKDWRTFRAGDVPLGPPPRFDAIDYLATRASTDEEIVPFLTNLIEDKTETESVRIHAIEAVRTLGEEGLPVLEQYVDSDEDPIRERARIEVANLHGKISGPEERRAYYESLVEQDPFDPHVPEYLIQFKRMKGPSKRLQTAAQEVKERIRSRIAQDPHPEAAWILAQIIQDQIRSTDLGWGKVYRYGQLRQYREDPSENFEGLEEALRIAYSNSEPGSELARKSGYALARLYLLKGDWARMNRVLGELGMETVNEEEIPWLAPPNALEEESKDIWRICDESMRSGNCGLVIKVVDYAGGIKGAQVIVRKPEPPEREGPTGGIRPAINPFHWAEVIEDSWKYYRYLESDARFGVTDDLGSVKFENLPKIPVDVDVLVPNGLLAQGWVGGELAPEGRISRFELKEGETVEYPTFRVKSVQILNYQDGDPMEDDDFVLTWPEFQFASETDGKYEIGLLLYGPSQSIQRHELQTFSARGPIDSRTSCAVRWATQVTETNSWPIAERGVGEIELIPGNTYWVWVSALDESGTEIARYEGVRFWVPWKHRKTLPPNSITKDFVDVEYQPPMLTYMEWASSGNRIEMCEKFIKSFPDTFEYDYACLGWAWLIWHDGKREESLAELDKLSKELPMGNVVQVTAAEYADQLHRGEELPQTFKLGGSMNMARSFEERYRRR